MCRLVQHHFEVEEIGFSSEATTNGWLCHPDVFKLDAQNASESLAKVVADLC